MPLPPAVIAAVSPVRFVALEQSLRPGSALTISAFGCHTQSI